MISNAVPRLVIAASGSGVGKTTVTVALIAALRKRSLKVAAFKCGPDYLDPGYHQQASGSTSHNLDSWMMGSEGVRATFAEASRGADIAIIEGMMGLFDSAAPTSDEGSTAEIARLLGAPVLLVLDASGIARSIAASALGFSTFDQSISVTGLICNRVGGHGHLDLLQQVPMSLPVVGGLPSDETIAIPERHLGLLSMVNRAVPEEKFERLATLAAEWFDLDRIFAVAKGARPFPIAVAPARRSSYRCRIGIAYDEAFHFYYQYNLKRLEETGAELVRFSPIRDSGLPAVDGLYLGGGYPEIAASDLAANHSMIEAIRRFAAKGGPIYAECGGLMYLAEGIRTLDGQTFSMVGLVPGVAVMHDDMQAIGYVEVEATENTFLGPVGTRWRGHQFRYSTLEADPQDVDLVYRVSPRWGGSAFAEGFRRGNVVASYAHAHWASNPEIPASFVAACVQA